MFWRSLVLGILASLALVPCLSVRAASAKDRINIRLDDDFATTTYFKDDGSFWIRKRLPSGDIIELSTQRDPVQSEMKGVDRPHLPMTILVVCSDGVHPDFEMVDKINRHLFPERNYQVFDGRKLLLPIPKLEQETMTVAYFGGGRGELASGKFPCQDVIPDLRSHVQGVVDKYLKTREEIRPTLEVIGAPLDDDRACLIHFPQRMSVNSDISRAITYRINPDYECEEGYAALFGVFDICRNGQCGWVSHTMDIVEEIVQAKAKGAQPMDQDKAQEIPPASVKPD